MDRLQSMAVFVKAVDSGSFAAAGAALGMSAQMVGKHVTALEERLGARLLNRTTRRQSLTEIGRDYHERCRLLLADFEASETIAQNHSAAPRGRLRITAPVTYGTYALMPVINRYLREFPEVQVELDLSDRLVDIVDEGFDVAIRIGALGDSNLNVRALPPYRLIACAAPDYLARHGTPTSLNELAAHDCLGFKFLRRPTAREWTFVLRDQLQLVQLDARFQVNDARAELAAARDGVGIMLGAEVMLAQDIASGRLVRLFEEHEPPSRPVNLLFIGGRRLTPKTRAFIDMLVADSACAAS